MVMASAAARPTTSAGAQQADGDERAKRWVHSGVIWALFGRIPFKDANLVVPGEIATHQALQLHLE
jgi:hypothetical protein